MEPDEREKYLEAGKIAAKVREESKNMIKPGVKLLDVAERIEQRIRELGGEPAFPVNISVNHIAAHYTPEANDTSVFNEGDLVKIDIGVHIDGYIGDTAVSVLIGNDEEAKRLIEASETALKKAIEAVKPGTNVGEIGGIIEKTVTEFGFKPVRNLTGHGLARFDLHAPPQIPNVGIESAYELKKGEVIAIEPFATTGSGFVREEERTMIFTITSANLMTRNFEARRILEFAAKRGFLPFTKRWLNLDEIKLRFALRELMIKNVLYEYPVLSDVKGCKVAQAEHTIIVDEQPVITTL